MGDVPIEQAQEAQGVDEAPEAHEELRGRWVRQHLGAVQHALGEHEDQAVEEGQDAVHDEVAQGQAVPQQVQAEGQDGVPKASEMTGGTCDATSDMMV